MERIVKENPYFSYSKQELDNLREIQVSNESLKVESFAKWDPLIYRLTEEEKSLDRKWDRFMGYLYNAQRDFTLLSYQISNKWIGDISPLMVKLIHLFYPDFQLQESFKEELYSKKLSDLIFSKIEKRFLFEENHLKEYPSPIGPNHWNENPPIGRRIGSCMKWLLTSLEEVKAAVPPKSDSIIWVYGIEQIIYEQTHLTAEQRELIKYWAGDFGPESGNWFAIVNRELGNKQLSLSDFLLIRAVFAMGFIDAMIAAFDSKYTFWVMRPTMKSKKIHPLIPVPKHPSYPSAHSVTSSATAGILAHFFPNEKEKYQALAIQAGNTRIWGGLHYVYDHEEGLIQGEKVANEVIKKIQDSK